MEELVPSLADLHAHVRERRLDAEVPESLDPGLGVQIDRVDERAVHIEQDRIRRSHGERDLF